MARKTTHRASWLEFSNGSRVRIAPRGVLLGRRTDNDVVLEDPRASSVHAMVHMAPDGPEVHAMGRNPTLVNGEAVKGRQTLKDGDVIDVPGARVQVRSAGGAQRIAWTIELADGTGFGIRTTPLLVGGGLNDDIVVPGWPEAGLRLHTAQGALVADLGEDGLLAGDPVEAGSVEMLQDGDSIQFGAVTVRVRAKTLGDSRSTMVLATSGLPISARFEFLPNGGTLRLAFGDGQRATVDLAEMRARLVASLLDPPGEYTAGEFIPDEVLLGRIWPGQPQRGRTDLNLLIHRTRKDLLQAGINPTPVLERARMGLATCFRLAPGAEVEVC